MVNPTPQRFPIKEAEALLGHSVEGRLRIAQQKSDLRQHPTQPTCDATSLQYFLP